MDKLVDAMFDSTVVLGAHLGDAAHRAVCSAALALAEEGVIQGWICSHSLCEIAETLARALGQPQALRELAGLRSYLRLASARETIVDAALSRALSTQGLGLDDALLVASASADNADYIVTLNAEDLTHSAVPVVTPQQLLERFPPKTGAA
ncbi:MAG: PIN domain-containing protein [Thiohalocapsa sp.]|nr:PIN domain-containing protein [Thiohalocapsa sp.]MCF7991323.1 PIN domain-containing protein [Thiohalocapsa sp.]